jgi:hypothetical protein
MRVEILPPSHFSPSPQGGAILEIDHSAERGSGG